MITIHGSIPSKKNSKKIIQVHGRILIVPSTKYEKWHRQAVKEVMSQKAKIIYETIKL